jgi:hypothetical protein
MVVAIPPRNRSREHVAGDENSHPSSDGLGGRHHAPRFSRLSRLPCRVHLVEQGSTYADAALATPVAALLLKSPQITAGSENALTRLRD